MTESDYCTPRFDDSVFKTFASKCNSLTALSVHKMADNTAHETRETMTNFMVTVLAQCSTLQKFEVDNFPEYSDTNESKKILSALSNSPCLPRLTHFSCLGNKSWFSKEKESKIELLSLALSKMTALESIRINVRIIENFMKSLDANHAANSAFKKFIQSE